MGGRSEAGADILGGVGLETGDGADRRGALDIVNIFPDDLLGLGVKDHDALPGLGGGTAVGLGVDGDVAVVAFGLGGLGRPGGCEAMGGPGASAFFGELALALGGLVPGNDGDGAIDEGGGNGAGANGGAAGRACLSHLAGAAAGLLAPRDVTRSGTAAERQWREGKQPI